MKPRTQSIEALRDEILSSRIRAGVQPAISTCEGCGGPTVRPARGPAQRFCSDRCRKAYARGAEISDALA